MPQADQSPIRLVPAKGYRQWSTGFGIGLIVLAAILVALAFFGPYPSQSLADDLPEFGLWALLGLFGLYLTMRRRRTVELADDSFSINGWSRRGFLCSDFTGYRYATTPTRYGYRTRYWLVGKPGRGNVMLISTSTEMPQYTTAEIRALRSWLDARFPDLEAADRGEEERERAEKRLHPDLAGMAPMGLHRARKIARGMQLASTGIIAVALVFPSLHVTSEPCARVFAIACCVLLPAVIAVKLWQPDSFQLGSFIGRSLPASLDPPFSLGALAPFSPVLLYFKPLRWTSPVAIGLLVSTLLGALLVKFGFRRLDRTPGVLAGVLLQLAAYGFAAVTALNGALDASRPFMTRGVILGHDASKGSSGWTYTLALGFEKPDQVQRNLRVSRELYDRARMGDGLGVFLGRGAFGIPWIRGVSGP